MKEAFKPKTPIMLEYTTETGMLKRCRAWIEQQEKNCFSLAPYSPHEENLITVPPGTSVSLFQLNGKTRYHARAQVLSPWDEIAKNLILSCPQKVKRTTRRRHLRTKAALPFASLKGVRGHVEEISESGARVNAPQGVYRVGDSVHLTIPLPSYGTIYLKALVIRVEKALRSDFVALMFSELHTLHQQALAEYVRKEKWAVMEQLGMGEDS